MFGRVKREPGAAHYFPQWVCAATKLDFNHSRKSLGEEFQRLARFLVGEDNAFAAVEVESDRRIRYVFMQSFVRVDYSRLASRDFIIRGDMLEAVFFYL
ncbi:hypothetical protein MCOR04_010562 [Pyricularia oryzae]|uniref:Uncharacterized protein n=1 Tax=Pyricularia oryzae TaxID=318829 RepID=A0A4P7NBJ7_PYROR|nr:hypothetical protein MCOR17_007136 [Pyricularia oryzae]KAI6554515.1 hypothetical protein MCOR04_010562 [Pyricularia oryzae]QBZ57620.1 hypothetical protein PoMZ_02552 [Pyricularia oryzae]